MNCDFIRSYVNYKIKYLSECASFFFMDYDKELIGTFLKTYFETYANAYFYHVLGTLDEATDYGIKTIQLELDGMKEEILDGYKALEFRTPNEEYIRNKTAIKEMVEICIFIIKLDWFKFSEKDSIEEEFNLFLKKFSNIKERLGVNSNKLLAKVKENYSLENKVFSTDKEYFSVDYRQVLKKDELYLINLEHNIRILQTNYKKSMVERVYTDERFNKEKCKTLFWKISRELMRKYLNNEKIDKYIVTIDDKMLQKGNIDLFKMIDNPFLKRYLVLAVSLNSYNSNREFVDELGFLIACSQNLLHINDVMDKLKTIDAENFKYILISDYKEKDKDTILGYKCSDEVELYITKEE